MAPIVTFLSDFGSRDGYVAAMKGVVLGIAPQATLVDASQEIAPGDVEAAAFVLHQYWELFPEGSVHLAVVDPGVGGARRALALEARGRFVVAPDNGLGTRVLRAAQTKRVVQLAGEEYRRRQPSATFHGRDIFAPAAAHLAVGVPLDRLGPPLERPVVLDLELPRRTRSRVVGRVAHVDRFGNLITDISAGWLGSDWCVEIGGRDLGALHHTYSEVDEGELLALIGSLETLEIAARGGSASERLSVGRGERVVCRRCRGRASRG